MRVRLRVHRGSTYPRFLEPLYDRMDRLRIRPRKLVDALAYSLLVLGPLWLSIVSWRAFLAYPSAVARPRSDARGGLIWGVLTVAWLAFCVFAYWRLRHESPVSQFVLTELGAVPGEDAVSEETRKALEEATDAFGCYKPWL